MKQILILGSTGSIGQSTLEVIRQHPELYKVEALVAGSNWQKLIEQALEFKPKRIAIYDASHKREITDALAQYNIKFEVGEEAVLEVCRYSYDIIISAIMGIAGLKPNIEAMKNSKTLAIANKESLICAGNLLLSEAKKFNCKIIPVDSEHSAIFQIFEKENFDQINKITITASGGAFRDFTLKQLEDVKPQMAMRHPNWQMGAKITVDCATLLNKGLEFIEAWRLFNIPPSNIEVIIHRQSIIHGMVSYKDGSTLAQLSLPDMKTPISYALSYPRRVPISHNELDLTQIKKLDFEKPDYIRFPLLKLAQECIEHGNYALIALNTSNEIAVENFLNNKIKFLDICRVVDQTLQQARAIPLTNFEDIFEYNKYIVKLTELIITKFIKAL